MREGLIARWSEVGDKLVKLAEEFPENKYGFRPADGTRSFAEQLRHVAFWNQYAEKTLRHKGADGQANELPQEKYPTKAKIVDVLRQSLEGVKSGATNHGAGPADVADLSTLEAFIEHNCEHYGQMVVYYRLNGLVPPASR